MKGSKSIFKIHVMPILLALLIVVLGGGIMFFVMSFGFGFENRVIEHDRPDGGIIYTENTCAPLTEISPWADCFDEKEAKPVNSVEDSEGQEELELEAARLARYYLGRAKELDVTADLSDAVVTTKRFNFDYGYIINKVNVAYEYIKCYDNCLVTFESDKKTVRVRFAFHGYAGLEDICSDLVFFEIDDTSDNNLSAENVNTAYKTLLESVKTVSHYKDFTSNLVYEDYPNMTAIDDGNSDKLVFDVTETLSDTQIIEYFLISYSLSYNERTTDPLLSRDNIVFFITGCDYSVSYHDGEIYVTWNMQSDDTSSNVSASGLTLKYSVAEGHIVGMALNDSKFIP